MNNKENMFLEQQTLTALFSAASKLQLQGDKSLASLSIRQLMTLIAITQLPAENATINNIARQMGTTKQNARQMLDSMEKKGYLSALPSEQDKRAVNIVLTPQGQTILKECAEPVYTFLTDIFKEFSSQETETLWALLKKLYRFDGVELGASEEGIETNRKKGKKERFIMSKAFQKQFDIDNLHSITMNAVSLPFEFIPTTEEELTITCPQLDNNDIISTEIRNGELFFTHEIQKFSFTFFSINCARSKVIVEIPVRFKGDLNIHTSNGRLSIQNLSLSHVRLQTSNGAIHMENLDCLSSDARTSNGAIKIDHLSGGNISLHTSNGAIKGTIRGNMQDYAISSGTSNGSNNLPNVCLDGKAKKLSAHTSNGKIGIEFI